MNFQNEYYEQVVKESNDLKVKLNNYNKDNVNLKYTGIIQDKLAELEDRSRRNNLRFDGFDEREEETWKDSESKVKEFLKEKLGIKNNIAIERAHRTGKKHESGKRKRTIVVKFLNYKDREIVLNEYKKRKLWNEKIYINEDYSNYTIEKRQLLFTKAKEFRAEGKFAKVIYTKLVTRASEV
ncbi:uncharacterized protein LOC136090007 [Hydra vulgaris]|uniref:Uncharacterized protein LOC136090007 n=1 Tax=Hydra vulgaris TaxID=6087 RepID=A0ABM4DCQ1_HYDVU